MRLSLKERRTRGPVQSCVQEIGATPVSCGVSWIPCTSCAFPQKKGAHLVLSRAAYRKSGQSTGAPSFAFFAKGGIVRSHPQPPTESKPVPFEQTRLPAESEVRKERAFGLYPRTHRRVPHISDFLGSFVGSLNFMRLSLMKGAHAVLSRAAYRKFGASRSFFARCGIPQASPSSPWTLRFVPFET
jgi:hypothetical protein